jgi:hypothetical protein
MATRCPRCLVDRTWVSAQKSYNFWSDRWIPLKHLQGFLEVVLLGVAMEWPLGDEDVLSPVLEYRLKRAITFDPTVGSRSKFSRGCFPWGSYGMATRWWRSLLARTWVSAQQCQKFWSDHWIALKRLPEFLEAVFLGVAIECYSVTRMYGRPYLIIGWNRP